MVRKRLRTHVPVHGAMDLVFLTRFHIYHHAFSVLLARNLAIVGRISRNRTDFGQRADVHIHSTSHRGRYLWYMLRSAYGHGYRCNYDYYMVRVKDRIMAMVSITHRGRYL